MASAPYRVSSIMASKLTPEQRDEFMAYCRIRPGAPAIQRYLKELSGEHVSLASIGNWYNNTFPSGKQAEIFRNMAEEFQGMDTVIAKDWLMGKTAILLSELHAKVDEGLLEEAAPENIIGMLSSLTREMRAISESASKEKYIRDRTELELAGAHRVAELIEATFKDTSFETAVRNAVKGALEQIEQEILGSGAA